MKIQWILLLIPMMLAGCAIPATTSQTVNNTYIIQNSSWNYVYGFANGMQYERADNLRFFLGMAEYKFMTAADLIAETTNYMVDKATITVIDP